MVKKVFFTWREAILKSSLPPTTRHVLLTLSCHMNDMGESCYPTIDQLVNETGLTRPTVIKHLSEAKKKGWIKVTRHGFGGQEWRNHEYTIGFPEGGQLGLPAIDEKVVNLVDKGGKNDTEKVVKQVNPSTTGSTSLSTSKQRHAGKPKKKTKKKTKFIPPTKQEYIDFFVANGYPASLAVRAWDGYHAAEWHDSQGNPVRNWKQKAIHVWFRDGNKAKDDTAEETPFEKAVRLAKENKLQPFQGAPHESPKQFIQRVESSTSLS